MNAPAQAAKLTELQEVNRSLDLLLDAIIALDLKPRRERNLPPQPGAMTYAELIAERTFTETVAEIFARDLRHDPVRQALCYAVRLLGTRLHEFGGLQAMQDACDRQEDYPDGMRRVSIVDARWNSIGANEAGGGWWS